MDQEYTSDGFGKESRRLAIRWSNRDEIAQWDDHEAKAYDIVLIFLLRIYAPGCDLCTATSDVYYQSYWRPYSFIIISLSEPKPGKAAEGLRSRSGYRHLMNMDNSI